MKTHKLTIILLLLIFTFSCSEKSEKKTSNKEIEVAEATEILDPKVNLNELKTDFKKWWSYHYYTVSLASDFTGIDEQADTINKRQFLDKLVSGKYIPLRLKSNDGVETYKLFEIDYLADKSIRGTIKNESALALKHFKMEGLSFPKFDFTDLKNNRYTSENTKGKTIILKTWFIGCSACVAEFPELNELVKKYEQKNDIIFVSLAQDAKPELEKFLNKKAFEYVVVPDQTEFITKKLKLQAYPTHIIIDEKGAILKVVSKASELISFLELRKN